MMHRLFRFSLMFDATTSACRRLFTAVSLLLFMAAAASTLHAQAQNTGTVGGNIVDEHGAAIPAATLTLTDIANGRTVTVVSSGIGEYLFTDVPIGDYSLDVTATSFRNYVVKNIHVDADSNVRADAKLLAGAFSETITVQAESTVIDTHAATVGMMIEKQLVENLPIDGENIVSLAALLPGVSNVNAPTTFTSDSGGPTYSVNGSRSNQNLFLFDGMIWNNAYLNTGLNYPARLAMQEVSVLLNNYKAQYGRNSGSVFNAITRAGSNKIHGALWEYHQNDYFDAKDYITHRLPHLVQNQFGATIGGPIKRDKAFYFLAYQDLRLAGQIISTAFTQRIEQLGLTSSGLSRPCVNAAFSGLTCADFTADFKFVGVDPSCPIGTTSGACVTPSTAVRNPTIYPSNPTNTIGQLNSPYQLAGGTGNSPCVQKLLGIGTSKYISTPELPTICFNPVALAVVQKYFPNATEDIGASKLVALTAANAPRNDQQGLARVDLNLGRNTIDARFFVTNVNDLVANGIQSSTDQGIANYEQDANTAGIYAGNIGDTYVIRSNMLNVARLSYKRYGYIIMPTDHNTLQSFGSTLVVPATVASLPRLNASARVNAGGSNIGYSYTVSQNYELDDNLSWERGNHNIQFGTQFLGIQYVHRYDFVPTITTEQTNTGTSIGDFLLGLTYSQTVGNGVNLAAIQHNLYTYVQDDWRALPRLTLNFGLRYEIPFQWREKDGQGLTFIPGYISSKFANSPANIAYEGDPGVGSVSPPTRYNNFGPRFGLVYDLHGNGTASIRAGFGIFYNSVNAAVVGVGAPYHYEAFTSAPIGGFSQPLLGLTPIPPNFNKNSPLFATPFNINFADRHLATPYAMAFNVGLQQKVNKGSTLEVNYVGRLGRHELIAFDNNPAIYDCSGGYYQINPSLYCPTTSTAASNSYAQRVKYPGFNYGGQGIVDNASIGTSNYNALQAIYTQRNFRNITVFASYTFSKSFDLSSDGLSTTARVPQPTKLYLEHALSDFDARQVFNLGWTYKLPEIGKRHNAVLRGVVNGWIYGGIYNARTGNPFNVTVAGDISYTNERPQRPNLVPGMNPRLSSDRHRKDKLAEWFNTKAFAAPSGGTFGNVPRNFLTGPAYINTNMNLEKNMKLPREGTSLQLRLDGFNVFNTPNLANPLASLASASANDNGFGSVTATVGTNGVVGSNGRRVQIGAILRY